MIRLYMTFENGRTADIGEMPRPHDGIGAARRILSAMPSVAYLQWRDGSYVAFEATRVSARSFGWRSSSMAAHAFGELA